MGMGDLHRAIISLVKGAPHSRPEKAMGLYTASQLKTSFTVQSCRSSPYTPYSGMNGLTKTPYVSLKG